MIKGRCKGTDIKSDFGMLILFIPIDPFKVNY